MSTSNRRPDDLLPDEARLHEVNEAAKAAEPPAEADLAVLRRARAAVRDEAPGAARRWTQRRLAGWAGAAAVAMLAVAVVVQQRAPDGMPATPEIKSGPQPPARVLHDAAEFRQRSADSAAPQAAPPPPAEQALQRTGDADQAPSNAQVTGSRISRVELEKSQAATVEETEATAAAEANAEPPPRYAGTVPPPTPEEWRTALRAWQALGAQDIFLAELAAFQAAYPEEDAP